ncbi:DUF7380 domain-containing protein [Sphingopyxis sp. NJF-3]
MAGAHDGGENGKQTEPGERENQRAAPTEVRPLFTADQLVALDLNDLLRPVADEDEYAVEQTLRTAARQAREGCDAMSADALAFIADILGIRVHSSDEAKPFAPMVIVGEQRSLIPDDIAGSQSDILATVAAGWENLHLRAKVGDLVFYNARKHWQAAGMALEAYCHIARGRLDDSIRPRVPDRVSILDVVTPLARAAALGRRLSKRGAMPARLTETFSACYDAAIAGAHYVAFNEIGNVGLAHELRTFEEVARDAEALAASARPDVYPEAVKRVWILAAGCHERAGAGDDGRRCRLAAAEATLRMRDQSDQAAVKAHWTKAALGEMRDIPGTRERVLALREELKAFQATAQDDHSAFHYTLDLGDQQRAARELLADASFARACLLLSNMADAPSRDELRALVLESAREHPLAASIGASYYDAEGREAARVEALSDAGPSENWYRAECAKHMEFVMQEQVHGRIEPARLTVIARMPVEERHLAPIVDASPFVPRGRAPLFALAFSRMFQGDYASASHLLFPQLENSLRHLLMLTNCDPSKIEQDLLQGDRALAALLDVNRGELEAIFGIDRVHQIDILFNFRPGPALRNEAAHGKLPWGAFFHHTAIFGCWFIFTLACRPLYRDWYARIAPRLDAAFGAL